MKFQVCPGCKVFHDVKTYACEACGYVEIVPTKEDIKLALGLVRERYETHLRSQLPSPWTSDQRTLDIYSLGCWLSQAVTGLVSEDRRRELLWYFNRTVRAEQDPFQAMETTIAIHLVEGLIPAHYRYFHRRH